MPKREISGGIVRQLTTNWLHLMEILGFSGGQRLNESFNLVGKLAEALERGSSVSVEVDGLSYFPSFSMDCDAPVKELLDEGDIIPVDAIPPGFCESFMGHGRMTVSPVLYTPIEELNTSHILNKFSEAGCRGGMLKEVLLFVCLHPVKLPLGWSIYAIGAGITLENTESMVFPCFTRDPYNEKVYLTMQIHGKDTPWYGGKCSFLGVVTERKKRR